MRKKVFKNGIKAAAALAALKQTNEDTKSAGNAYNVPDFFGTIELGYNSNIFYLYPDEVPQKMNRYIIECDWITGGNVNIYIYKPESYIKLKFIWLENVHRTILESCLFSWDFSKVGIDTPDTKILIDKYNELSQLIENKVGN